MERDKVLLVLSAVCLTQRANAVSLLCGKILTFSWGPLTSKIKFCVGMHQYTEIWGLDIKIKTSGILA